MFCKLFLQLNSILACLTSLTISPYMWVIVIKLKPYLCTVYFQRTKFLQGFLLTPTEFCFSYLKCTRCSFCRLIRHPRSFSERSVGRHHGIPWQTEGQPFGDHLISKSVSVVPSSVTEASFYCALFCVFMTSVRYN
jgi:hypothetical protein